MRRNFNSNNLMSLYAMSIAGDAEALADSIVPDINIAYKSASRKASLFFFLIIVSIITLIGPIIFVLIMTSFDRKARNLKLIVDLKDEIEAQDKTSLDNLFLSNCIGKNSVIIIINKLIETGNLRYYEIIGNAGVAKIELSTKESDFHSVAANEVVPDTLKTATENINMRRVHKCPNCGAAITCEPEDFVLFAGLD